MSNEEFRIAVLGSGGVGKTCLVLRLTRQTFDPEYIPTIQDYFEKKFVIEGKDITTKIIDTAGQDEMQGITDIGIKDAQACIIVYSVTSQLSFNEVEKFREKVNSFSQGAQDKIVLVGNKCDMQERVVQTQQGANKAQQWGVPFFETSAKKDINVQQAFEAAVKKLVDKCSPPGAASSAKPQKEEGGCCQIA
ncbi:Ras-related protein Rap-1b [Tritrichomonas foetus]|uniref:Ras-related protein Rap-1b n=1 Tax=Tritrichomonas foetus TaxID=1144522 RepID=A0A1J4L3U3_9EUKA|nr:Ras-related protein Rap-1b [Tritrichomonas foetus]|eukprot:OHT16622.1 Ras-related protein Rap-1b [Tritrichomonas foetus]